MLASASPARRRTLIAAGFDPEVIVSGVDESSVQAADAEALCLVLARMKAQAVATGLPAAGPAPGSAGPAPGSTGPSSGSGGSAPASTVVLGCDSLLAFDGEIFGKPADADDAVKRWQRMRGRSGVLHTGHHLVEPGTGRHAEAVASTRVHFADVSDAEITAYVATGEPLQVAGAFTIDGLGGSFVERVEGDHGNVIGISLPLLRRLLAELGWSVPDLWRPARS